MTEERTQTREVIEELATERGSTLDELAQEIADASRGYFSEEDVLGFYTDTSEAPPRFPVLVEEVLRLDRESETYRVIRAMMADVAPGSGC